MGFFDNLISDGSYRRALTEEEIPPQFRNVFGDRTEPAASVQAMEDFGDFVPGYGDVVGVMDLATELSKENPNYPLAAALGVGSLVGLVPGAGDVVQRGIVGAAERIGEAVPSDVKYAGRSIAEGDLRGFLDAFLPGGEAQSLSADVVRQPFDMGRGPVPSVDQSSKVYDRSGEELSEYLAQFPSAQEVVTGEVVPPMSNVTNIKSEKPIALFQHKSTGILSDETVSPLERGSISNLLGRDVMSIVGDQSGRHTITSVNDAVFETPQKSLAGFEFTDIPDQGYAGALSATQSKLREAERSVDPYVMSILMGEKSSDFSLHEGMVFGEMFKSAQIDPKDVAKADEMIRNISKPELVVKRDADGNPMLNKDGSKKTQSVATKPYVDAPSVSDPKAMQEYIASLPSGTHRAYFLKGMDKATLHKLGIPKVQDARLAVADAAQLGMDWGTTGYRGFTPDVSKGVLEMRPDQSTTYQYGYDKIEDQADTYLTGSRGIPANLLFRNLAEEQRAKGTGGGLLMNSADYKVYEASPKRAKQRIEDIDVETVDSFLEVERRFGREAAMKFAQDLLSSGKVTAKMIEKARKLNAPNWVIAAMVPMAAMQESEQ